MKEIIDDRQNGDYEYTDDHLRKMIKNRYLKIAEYENNKEVFVENGCMFIDDDKDLMGFKRYVPKLKITKRYVKEVFFLIHVINSM
jgi:hypothetical protein